MHAFSVLSLCIEQGFLAFGKWEGEGCSVYPTISPFMYGEEIIFGHVGQPMLSYR